MRRRRTAAALRSTRRAVWVVLLASSAGLADAPSPARFVLDATFDQRSRDNPVVRAAEVDSLVLPHVHALNVIHGPYICRARSRPTLYPMPDRVLWCVVPKTDLHDEYLERRAEVDDRKKRLELVDWCEKNRLDACAEFELRLLLREIGDISKPGYRSVIDRWLRLAARRPTDYTFPLPVEGEWYVIRDANRHHREKHGSAFAFDLVIRKSGKMYRGDHRDVDNHYAFGRPFVAQADGLVVQVEDRFEDVRPGVPGRGDRTNTVTVDYGAGIVGFYGHLRQHSAKVKVGDRVRPGQVLAEVGNSGTSGIPHLHFSMLDQAYFSVKGRFRYELKRSGKWRPVDGEDLSGGTDIRNPGDVFKVKESPPDAKDTP
ncbi:MAG TPA: M23 family metallopeptidase [Planctomycetota bacterium]|nr:M23 family metallopeptidase [Planctomycetota bacterium]